MNANHRKPKDLIIKTARIKKVHSKLISFQDSLCTLTATHLTLIFVVQYIRRSVPLGCLIKPAEIIIRIILNLWKTPRIEPVIQTNSPTA